MFSANSMGIGRENLFPDLECSLHSVKALATGRTQQELPRKKEHDNESDQHKAGDPDCDSGGGDGRYFRRR